MVSPSYRKSKKIYLYGLVFLVVGLLLCMVAVEALAFDVCINGVPVELPIRPSLRQGKVMLPLNCLAYPLGLEIECAGEEAPIFLTMGNERVVFSIDNPQALVNDEVSVDLGTVPYRKQDEVMVPMNFFVDALGITVDWDKGGQVLLIEGGNRTAIEPVANTSDFVEQETEIVPIADGPSEETQKPDALPSGEEEYQVELEVESAVPGFEQGLNLLAISQFLQEMRTQTSALAGDYVLGQAQGTRLVGVLPGNEKGRQRLDFITDAKVEVRPMLLADPARLVLDVEGAIVEAIDDELYVGQGVIHRVRLSQYQDGIARAVVDLAEVTGYQIEEIVDGNGFSVVFNQRIGRVNLWRSGSTVGLGMETSGPVQYTVRKLNSPNRMVVDIENATFVAGSAEVSVKDTTVKTLRISQYTPTIARIVMELDHPLDIADIDAGTSDREIELAFLDTGWGSEKDLEKSIRSDLAKTTRQDVAGAALTGLRRLATLGHSLVNLLPSSKVLAMEATSLTEIATTPAPREEDSGISATEVDKPSDGEDSGDEIEEILAGSWVESRLGQIRFDGFGGDDEPEPKGEPSLDPLPASPDQETEILDPPYRPVDFSRWPRLQANWIGSDARAALQGRSILIDAGHGGFQPGAPGVKGLWEKTFNLELALRVGELLQWAGARVSYTRTQDQTISLRERVDKVQAVDAEILVSIHANASLTRDATGTETLYHPAIQASRSLAEVVQKDLVGQLGLPDRGIKQRNDLYILRHSPVPSALVEVGFIDHPEEGIFLMTSEAIDKASMGLVRGIAAFFRDNPVLPRPAEAVTPLEQWPQELEDSAENKGEDSEGEDLTSDRPTGSDLVEQTL